MSQISCKCTAAYFVLLFLLVPPEPILAQGSVQATLSQLGNTSVFVLQFNWTADSGGNVPVTAAGNINPIQGYEITAIECVPANPAPSNNYSVKVLDASGLDVLAGAANAVSGTQAQTFAAAPATPNIQGSLRLQIGANTAAGAQGAVYVFVQKPGTVSARRLKGLSGAGGGGGGTADWLTLANAPFMDARRYNFSPQAPGGTLSAGSNTVNLVPCPQGVNGNDSGHRLYISGGTGTAEAVLITGGGCVSGAATGTVTFTAANAHAGAWTIQSATNGIQEAVQLFQTAATGGIVYIPPGTYNQCGTVTVTGDGIVIQGAGKTAAIIKPCFANEQLFSVPAGHAYPTQLSKMEIRDLGFNNANLVGIVAINLVSETGSSYRNLNFVGGTNAMKAFYCDRCYSLNVFNMTLLDTVGSYFGSSIDGTSTYSYSNTVWIDYYTYEGAAATIPVLTLERCSCIVSHFGATNAFVTSTGTGIVVANDSQGVILDNIGIESMNIGIWLQQTTVGTTTANPSFVTISNTQVDWGGNTSTAFAMIKIDGGTNQVDIIKPKITGPTTAGYGIVAFGGSAGLRIEGGFFNLTAGQNVSISAPSTGLIFRGNTMVSGAALVFPASGNITNAIISDNYITVSPVSSASTFVNSLFQNNVCPNDPSAWCSGILGLRAPKDINYINSESGAANAIAGALTDSGGNNMALNLGLRVCVNLSHSLQAGANTFSLNGTAKPIRSHFNPAANIASAYAAGAQWCGIYDGTSWQDVSQ